METGGASCGWLPHSEFDRSFALPSPVPPFWHTKRCPGRLVSILNQKSRGHLHRARVDKRHGAEHAGIVDQHINLSTLLRIRSNTWSPWSAWDTSQSQAVQGSTRQRFSLPGGSEIFLLVNVQTLHPEPPCRANASYALANAGGGSGDHGYLLSLKHLFSSLPSHLLLVALEASQLRPQCFHVDGVVCSRVPPAPRHSNCGVPPPASGRPHRRPSPQTFCQRPPCPHRPAHAPGSGSAPPRTTAGTAGATDGPAGSPLDPSFVPAPIS